MPSKPKSGPRKKSSSASTGASINVNAFATKMGAKRPNHIVLFRRPSEENETVLRDVLKVKRAGVRTAIESCALFEGGRGGTGTTRLYRNLGVATADLSEEEANQLKGHGSVKRVFTNERRSIPPTPADDTLESSPVPIPAPGPIPDTPMQAYLAGMRDAADLALRLSYRTERVALPGAPTTMIAASGSVSWCLRAIGIDEHYAVATGNGVKVAVLDTGVYLDHPDFKGAFIEGVNAVSFVEGESVNDLNGHGTHCIGVIGATAEPEGIGRYSVAPEAEMLAGKVLDNGGSGWDDQIIEGIEWAVEQGAQVISMSLGSPRQVGEPFNDLYETLAETFHDGGTEVLFVAAAGNESNRRFFQRSPVGNPAACPSFLSVAAVDSRKSVANFSNAELDGIGRLDISGPGVAVASAWTGGGYRSIAGTSMATPHVAAVAALLLERDATLGWRGVRKQLLAGAQPLGNPSDYGAGLVQAPQGGTHCDS